MDRGAQVQSDLHPLCPLGYTHLSTTGNERRAPNPTTNECKYIWKPRKSVSLLRHHHSVVSSERKGKTVPSLSKLIGAVLPFAMSIRRSRPSLPGPRLPSRLRGSQIAAARLLHKRSDAAARLCVDPALPRFVFLLPSRANHSQAVA